MITIILLINILISQEWTVYNKDNSDLHSNYIHDVMIDNDDNVWVINDYTEIFKIKDSEWTRFNSQNTNISNFYYRTLSLGLNNKIIAGPSGDKGSPMLFYDGLKWEFNYYKDLPIFELTTIYDVLEINENELWMATSFGAYHLKNGHWSSYLQNEEGRDLSKVVHYQDEIYVLGKGNFKLNKESNYFENNYKIFPDDARLGPMILGLDNFVYFYSKFEDDKLKKYDGKNWFDFNLGILDSNLITIRYTNNNKFYLQTRKSIYEILEEDKLVKLFTVPDLIMQLSNQILLLEDVDSKNNFWFTMYTVGLVKYSLEPNSVRKTSKLTIYPNPSQSKITVNTDQQITELALYTINLTKVKDYTPNHKSSQEIDISNLSSGVYFIKVNDDFIKFVKE